MSVNTELSALLTKMGGTPLESDSNSDLIKKISHAYEGGVGSSGGGMFITNVIEELAPDEDEGDSQVTPTPIDGHEVILVDNGTYVHRLDKTAGEIENAFLRGMTIVVHDDTDYYFPEHITITSNESSYYLLIGMPDAYASPSFSSGQQNDYPSDIYIPNGGGR